MSIIRVFCYYLFNLVWLYLNLFNLKKFGISNKNDYLYDAKRFKFYNYESNRKKTISRTTH